MPAFDVDADNRVKVLERRLTVLAERFNRVADLLDNVAIFPDDLTRASALAHASSELAIEFIVDNFPDDSSLKEVKPSQNNAQDAQTASTL